LKVALSEYPGYYGPKNRDFLGKPFLFFGFLSVANGSKVGIQGLEVNGVRAIYNNTDGNPNSQITLFPNFFEYAPSAYNVSGKLLCDKIFLNTLPNPSGRVMPPEYFMFAETWWGGGGCYRQTNQFSEKGLLGVNIGFQ